MYIDEAMAVYLYLMHQKRNEQQEKAFNEAWGAICQQAEKVIAAGYPRS